MSTVQIRPENGGYAILLEGHDISHLVAADGLEVSFSDSLTRRLCEPERACYPTVRITLAAGLSVDADLPDALVETILPADDEVGE